MCNLPICHCNVLSAVAMVQCSVLSTQHSALIAIQLGLLLQRSRLPLQRHLISCCNTLICHCNATWSPVPTLSSPIAMPLGLQSPTAALSSCLPLQRDPVSPSSTRYPPLQRHSVFCYHTLVCHCNATRSSFPVLPSPIAMPFSLPFQHSHLLLQCNSVSCCNILVCHCNAT